MEIKLSQRNNQKIETHNIKNTPLSINMYSQWNAHTALVSMAPIISVSQVVLFESQSLSHAKYKYLHNGK